MTAVKCARCGTPDPRRRWSPPELDGYFIRVCQGCLDYLNEERRRDLASIHQPAKESR